MIKNELVENLYGLHRLYHLATEIYDLYDSFDPYSLQDYESTFERRDDCIDDIAVSLINCPAETINYLSEMIANYGVENDAPFYKAVESTIREVNRFTKAINGEYL